MKRNSEYSRRQFINLCAAASAGAGIASLVGRRRFANITALLPSGPAARIFSFDKGWLFGGKFSHDMMAQQFDDRNFIPVTLPSTVKKLSWQNWNPSDWEDVWIYRKHFDLPTEALDGRVFLRFDGVMVGITPELNGRLLPEHLGGYLPYEYEVTGMVKATGNVLAVKVDSRWSNVPPEGSPKGPKRIDYLEPGGIVRSAQIKVVPDVFISDVFAKPVDVLDSNRHIDITCSIDAAHLPTKEAVVRAELLENGTVIARHQEKISVEKAGLSEHKLVLSKLGNVRLWDVEAPHLYDVVVTLLLGGVRVHNYVVRTGLRDAKFELGGFFLNGRRLQIFGLNRHELFPYVGFAMPSRAMRRDAEILRHEFHCNMVRCSHYPQTEAFYDTCDELGLMAWEEVPGWGYLGDESWKDKLIRDVRSMIIRDRNHPSVIIWGTRVNESANDVGLYRKTRALAKSLDDSRPSSGTMTGGSRKTWKTDWHEDVFAFDDYHAGRQGGVGIEKPVEGFPYLITEAVGQFNYADPKTGFSAKYRRAGPVDIQEEQAIWHAQAHSRAAEDPRICGVIAWCAFEYGSLVNSYRNVKYPGVADIFRIPKLGASFYRSQVDPGVSPVIIPNFYWSFDPKTPNGPAKHVAIFSNCERLEVYVDGQNHASPKPDSGNFPNLKYPPFFVDLELSGAGYPELRIDGYVGDKKVLMKAYSSDPSQDMFEMRADESEIIADGSDATRIVFGVVDRYGEPRLHGRGQVKFELTGPGILVGDNPFDLEESGGLAAVWVKSVPDHTGVIAVTGNHRTLGSRSLRVHVTKPQRKEVSI